MKNNFPPKPRTVSAATASSPGRHSDSGANPLTWFLPSARGLRRDLLPGGRGCWPVSFIGLLLALLCILLLAFADAATPTPSIELPRWQFGKPQAIEATLFP